jgi:Protein of unknown function (DUF2599)
MRVILFAAATATALSLAPPASAEPPPPPPYIDHTEWYRWGDLSSLRVYPTPAGREASTRFTSPDPAWAEVLVAAPEAEIPGMREQFACHWQLAEYGEPGKVSWNLEPWRPVVGPAKLLEAGCNPGGIDDPV